MLDDSLFKRTMAPIGVEARDMDRLIRIDRVTK
jgi:hypothetical protein